MGREQTQHMEMLENCVELALSCCPWIPATQEEAASLLDGENPKAQTSQPEAANHQTYE